ncbi:hypothetical protein ACOME3_006625 [Neoechinorhynchus agilis]
MLNCAILHPDLGIGGAERLILDMALALRLNGHGVHIYTNHFDPSRCFKESCDQFEIITIAQWLPRSILNKFHALCAYLKMFLTAMYVCFIERQHYELIVLDQLLVSGKQGFIKRLYRYPINKLEETSTCLADKILVNSSFTQNVVSDLFKGVRQADIKVLYPCVRLPESKDLQSPPIKRRTHFLSFNRFELKKRHDIAVKAVLLVNESRSGKVELTVAGGYDERLEDNRRCLSQLQSLASDCIHFETSISDERREELLTNTCTAVVYTPDREHFGIVPLEAMAHWKPVVAMASGGPLESIKHEETGYLCEEHTPESFAFYMGKLADDWDLCRRMGQAARNRVEREFAFEKFTKNVGEIIEEMWS